VEACPYYTPQGHTKPRIKSFQLSPSSHRCWAWCRERCKDTRLMRMMRSEVGSASWPTNTWPSGLAIRRRGSVGTAKGALSIARCGVSCCEFGKVGGQCIDSVCTANTPGCRTGIAVKTEVPWVPCGCRVGATQRPAASHTPRAPGAINRVQPHASSPSTAVVV
jgi:hypothetical protein